MVLFINLPASSFRLRWDFMLQVQTFSLKHHPFHLHPKIILIKKKKKRQWRDLPCLHRTGTGVVNSVNWNHRWAGGNKDKEADVFWQNLSLLGLPGRYLPLEWQLWLGCVAQRWGISGMGHAWEQRLHPVRLRSGDCSVLICCTSENTGWLQDPD